MVGVSQRLLAEIARKALMLALEMLAHGVTRARRITRGDRIADGDMLLVRRAPGSRRQRVALEPLEIGIDAQIEQLADAAEKTSIAAAWMGGRTYPQQRINEAWMLALGGHFHDTGAGTATPRSYEFAWNDDVIVANQFAGIFTNASEAIASALDTQVA